MTGFNAMTNNFFCMIEDGIIYQVDSYNKVAIGHTNESYNNLQQITDEYYNKLVELGVILPQKTQEEINAELQKALSDSQKINLEMLEVIKSLKGCGDNEPRNDPTRNQEDVPEPGHEQARSGND